MTTATVERAPQRQRRLRELGAFVDRKIRVLQQGFLRGDASAVAALAQLRRGVGKDVGELAELWEHTLKDVPGLKEDQPDEATVEEIAAYTAITLYAVHQQSRMQAVHVPDRSLGDAVRTLRFRAASEDAVRRRFEALGTAETFPEVVHHARSLITQLRSHNIPMDYGLLADALWWLQRGGAARVRLAWGRDFYRKANDDGDSANSQPESDNDQPAA